MALPQQVIDRLSQDSPKTPGWSYGLLLFSGGILFIVVLIYLGLAYGYAPYLQGQLDTLNAQVDAVGKTISPADQANLISYYSEITNIQAALQNHVIFTRFLAWLEAHTEVNVYFSQFTFSSSGNQITLGAIAKTEGDVNQQVAIFEGAPEILSTSLTGATLSPTNNLWQFSLTLKIDPNALLRMPNAVTNATSTTSSSH